MRISVLVAILVCFLTACSAKSGEDGSNGKDYSLFELRGFSMLYDTADMEPVTVQPDFQHFRLKKDTYALDLKWSKETSSVDMLDYLRGVMVRAPEGTAIRKMPRLYEADGVEWAIIELLFENEIIEFITCQLGRDFYSVAIYVNYETSEENKDEIEFMKSTIKVKQLN